MKYILKLVAIETLISFVIEFLLSTIKNADSAGARRVRSVMLQLRVAVTRYFERFPDTEADSLGL